MIPSLGLGRRITGLRYRRRRGLIVPWRLLVTTATVFARHEVFKLCFNRARNEPPRRFHYYYRCHIEDTMLKLNRVSNLTLKNE